MVEVDTTRSWLTRMSGGIRKVGSSILLILSHRLMIVFWLLAGLGVSVLLFYRQVWVPFHADLRLPEVISARDPRLKAEILKTITDRLEVRVRHQVGSYSVYRRLFEKN